MSSLWIGKNYARAAKVAVCRVLHQITWVTRRFPLLISPFYGILKGVGLILATAIAGDLILKVVNLNQPTFQPATRFIETHIHLVAIVIVEYLALLILARVGRMERRLRATFPICKAADELKFADLGFREVHPQEAEVQESFLHTRPFFGTYFPRKVVDWPEYSKEGEAEIAPLLGEDVLQQLLQQGQGFLLLGPPISGKTLTLFQVLRRMTGYTVVSADCSRRVPDEETFQILRLLKGRRVVILLDDLATLPLDYDLALFRGRIDKATGSQCGVAGTCRWGGTSQGKHVTQFCEGLRKFRPSWWAWLTLRALVDNLMHRTSLHA